MIIDLSEFKEPAIEFERTLQFCEAVQAISDYLKDLPLTADQDNQLHQMMLEMVYEASKGALVQGFNLGLGINEAM